MKRSFRMYEYLLLGLLRLAVRYVRGYEQLLNDDPFVRWRKD